MHQNKVKAMRVREILKEKGLTTKDLAEQLGITLSGLNQHLAKNPSLKVVESIASALDVPLWELFASKEDIVGNDANENKTTLTCPHCGKPIVIEIAPINERE